jgi:dipeptidyl aminopeptidase/acylaminoacyl peptidase
MKNPFLILITGIIFTGLQAQDKPGNPALVSSDAELARLAAAETGTYKYSVEDYFKKPAQFSFQFSPNGLYFSYKERDASGKSHVYVKNTATNEVKRVIEEKDQLIRGYFWKGNSRLLFMMDKGGDENYHVYAVNLDGSNLKDLTPFDGVRAGVSAILKDQPEFVIMEMNKENPQIFEPYKVNVNTGEYTRLFENKDPQNPIMGFDFDKDGELKAYTQQQNATETVLFYRTGKDKPFEEVNRTSWKNEFFIISFDYTTPNPHDAYVLTNLTNNTKEIILYDFAERKTIKKVFSDKTFDVGGLATSRKRGYEVDAYFYTGEKQEVVPVSATYKKLHATFKKQFGNKDFSITGVTDNEDKYLIYVGSDKLYGVYYFYDATNDSFKEIMNLAPQLKEDDMAEMRPVKFKSRDGLIIYGYLTIPKGASKSNKVPLILNPHGGPYGVRDDWGFNPETQLFASRGYATLQVNYRGSGGYGKEFFLAGNKQIGRNMLNDLEDGVAYAKTLGFIDEKKVAVYGGSYGGLATLGSLVKTPDLYACGVDYVGVSNLFTFFKSFPEYWKPFLGQVYEQWYDENSLEDQKIMKEVSPALNVDKIKKPLFVVQGANDPRVNIDESDQVVENLRKRNIATPYMVKYDEGHGFGHEGNQIEMYKCMMGFFAQHLK